MNGSGYGRQEGRGEPARHGSSSQSPAPPAKVLLDEYTGAASGAYDERSRFNPVCESDLQ